MGVSYGSWGWGPVLQNILSQCYGNLAKGPKALVWRMGLCMELFTPTLVQAGLVLEQLPQKVPPPRPSQRLFQWSHISRAIKIIICYWIRKVSFILKEIGMGHIQPQILEALHDRKKIILIQNNCWNNFMFLNLSSSEKSFKLEMWKWKVFLDQAGHCLWIYINHSIWLINVSVSPRLKYHRELI